VVGSSCSLCNINYSSGGNGNGGGGEEVIVYYSCGNDKARESVIRSRKIVL